jgi:hypothetical protein
VLRAQRAGREQKESVVRATNNLKLFAYPAIANLLRDYGFLSSCGRALTDKEVPSLYQSPTA